VHVRGGPHIWSREERGKGRGEGVEPNERLSSRRFKSGKECQEISKVKVKGLILAQGR